MVEIPTIEPCEIIAGNTVKWIKSLADYPASQGWELSYSMRGVGNIDIAAVASGDDHLVALAASTTADYLVGAYWWQSYVTNDGERYSVDHGSLTITPNLAAMMATYDGRSHALKTLEALEATIAGKASLDQLSYSIAGRSLSRLSPDELIKWRNEYRREVAKEDTAERIRKGLGGNTRLIKTRFAGR